MNFVADTKPTKCQQRAIDYFRHFMNSQLNKSPEFGDTLTEFTIESASLGRLWICAKTDMIKLSEGNALRALSSQYWFVLVGERGGLTVKMAPKAFNQFNRKRAFSMAFNLAL